MLRLSARPAGSPRMVTLPDASGTKPMMALNRVDLPEPLTPTSAVIVPRGMEKLASRSAVVAVAIGHRHAVRRSARQARRRRVFGRRRSFRQALDDGFAW